MVPHLSTARTWHCLTLVIKWELFFLSVWFDHIELMSFLLTNSIHTAASWRNFEGKKDILFLLCIIFQRLYYLKCIQHSYFLKDQKKRIKMNLWAHCWIFMTKAWKKKKKEKMKPHDFIWPVHSSKWKTFGYSFWYLTIFFHVWKSMFHVYFNKMDEII